jgi:hypothetical protein
MVVGLYACSLSSMRSLSSLLLRFLDSSATSKEQITYFVRVSMCFNTELFIAREVVLAGLVEFAC